MPSARSCFGWGLQSPVCYQPGGSLLHCLSTLTVKTAVYFCCTILGVTSTGRYPASCPLKPGLSSPAAFRFCSRDHLSGSAVTNFRLYHSFPFLSRNHGPFHCFFMISCIISQALSALHPASLHLPDPVLKTAISLLPPL